MFLTTQRKPQEQATIGGRNPTTLRPGREHADSLHRDLHPDLKADYVLANPPFNDSDWRGDLLKDDKRWRYDSPIVR